MGRRIWVGVYALAMALVEAAVVVYLRALHPEPASMSVLVTVLPVRLVGIEVAREAATLVMLLGVAMLAGRDRWERFLYFCLAFGIWDLGYYGWLWVMIRWPHSLFTWDVLFLIPVPWLAPVLAPVIVSVGLVAGSWLFLGRATKPQVPRWVWGLAGVGVVLVLLSFTLDYRYVLMQVEPQGFRWGLFGVGVGFVGLALAKLGRPLTPSP